MRWVIGLAAALPAQVEVVEPPSPCDMGAHYSQHVNPYRSCLAGREFVCVFQSHFVALTPRPAWLLISTAPGTAVDLTALGFPRCWLMVNTDPRHLHAIAPSKSGLVEQRNGRLIMRWTPADTMRGATVEAQMLWWDPSANAGQYLLGSMLRMTVE